MRHISFSNSTHYDIAILIKEASLDQAQLEKHYVAPLEQEGVSRDSLIAWGLTYDKGKKVSAAHIRGYLDKLLKALTQTGTSTLYVCDAAYFKVLTKSPKAEVHIGYVMPCKIKGYEHLNIILGVNYQSLYYDNKRIEPLSYSLDTLQAHHNNTHEAPGQNIIHSSTYEYLDHIAQLDYLHSFDTLTVDIEGYSLDFYNTTIATIAFAWDEHNGAAYDCNFDHTDEAYRDLSILILRIFFENYKGKLIFHGSTYDIKVLVSELWMNDLLDQKGMQRGIEILTRNMEDTLLIAYLATNSTAGNTLGLKPLSQEFAGNYAQEAINNITLIAREDLLRYNLIDCLSTWYVYNKYKPILIQDQQERPYHEIFLPSVKVVLQMEMTGMPLDMRQVRRTHKHLTRKSDKFKKKLAALSSVQEYENFIRNRAWVEKNLLLKVKVKPLSDFAHITFNPNSGAQIRELLYEHLNLPAIDHTDTGLPATGGDTLKKLVHKTKDPEALAVLQNLIGLGEITHLLSNFIKPFINRAVLKPDGVYYIHGNFNLGGTVSGRLSSSNVNLQNMPSTGTRYARLIKSCFIAPPGKILVGADFHSLEDKISALTTRDPNKLKVYTDGYDGHCLRAYSYFGDSMPDILDTVASINSIAKTYSSFRQDSKAPTFLLTYGGTAYGLVSTVGLSESEALRIERQYHELYAVSDEWVQAKIEQACKDGYVTVAFGLRVRTPILAKTIYNSRSIPGEAKAEARTAGNALGQSWGMLNNRAAIELRERLYRSPYRHDILPIAHIHDSQYFLIPDTLGAMEWLNENLVACMEWQDEPEIQDDQVTLGGELEVYYPNQATKTTIANGSSKSEILAKCKKRKDLP